MACLFNGEVRTRERPGKLDVVMRGKEGEKSAAGSSHCCGAHLHNYILLRKEK